MSSQFIVIDKTSGWANARIIKDKSFNNKVFTDSNTAYKEADKFSDGIIVGNIDDSTERVYTKKQILEFREKLIGGVKYTDLLPQFDQHFNLIEELKES